MPEPSTDPLALFRLDGRTAIVTGGGSGLGREIAIAFADAGARVVVADLDPDAAGQTAAARERIDAVELDVTDPDAVDELISRLATADVLVNAAGIGGWGPTATYPSALWNRVLEVNATGTFNTCRAFGAALIARGARGSIVNLASTLGIVGFPGTIAYVASKGAIVQLTRGLAVEWADDGVRVNALAPSTFETPLVIRNRPERPELYEQLLAATPARRFGRPSEIVGPALFLASEAASMVTGHILAVDGGYLAQ